MGSIEGEAPVRSEDSRESHEDNLVFQLPALHLKNTAEQIEYLILAWTLLLFRNTKTSSTPGFSWSFGEPVESNSTALPPAAVCSSYSVSEGSVQISKALGDVRAVFRSSQCPDFQDYRFILVSGAATAGDTPEWDFCIEVCVSGHQLILRQVRTLAAMSQDSNQLILSVFVDILQSILLNQEQNVADAIQVGERELAQLWQWNGVLPPLIDRCMHDIIRERCKENPNLPAVFAWDGELSYGELDRLSTVLASRLSELGVTVGTKVPLCFEKSMWTVVAVLAVMKAGGGFVLTDPQQPESRLRVIATEVGARQILVSEKNEDLGFRIAPTAEIVVVGPSLLNSSDVIPEYSLPVVPSSSTLYVIFTSGSTGKPKGVVISHENYTSGAIPRGEAVGYKPHSRVLDFASYAFDVSIDCMLCTLAQGGCVCVPSDESRVNDLGGAIKSLKVNMAHMTPSVARVLEPDVMASLEVLGLGGESVSSGDAAVWGQKTKVIIAYGPSECTVGCTINNDVGLGKTSIGKGVGGLTWIVDPLNYNHLTPIGAVGELLIEGPVVGQGYLNEPEKTSAVFIEDPAWLVAGTSTSPGRKGRLYMTGDLVKYGAGGCIVFVGRKDQQVKLRGQRVELGEIEYHMRSKLPVGTTVAAEVITPAGKASEPALVAFIVENQQSDATSKAKTASFTSLFQNDLQSMEESLRTELPIYMIPTAYIPISDMPSLVSCKIDRKKLRELGASMTKQDLLKYRSEVVEKQEIKTDMESKIHQIWLHLFGGDVEIGGQDNFFALGGDSLKAMKLVALARADGIALTVADVFIYPTLFKLALIARQVDAEEQSEALKFSLLALGWDVDAARTEIAELCRVSPPLIEDVYPCTPLQEGFMALSAKVSEAYIAQRVVELADLSVARKLQIAFEVVVADCPILRTRIVQVSGRGLVQVVVDEKISWHSSNSLEAYLEQDRNETMGLTDPLVRFAIINNELNNKVHLVLTIHHALYDGWSMPLIVERVNRAYNGQEIGHPASFSSFIGYLGRVDRSASEKYWLEQLNGAYRKQFPTLPEAGYQPQADSLLEHYVPIMRISDSKTTTTIATVIRGAWAFVVANYTGSNDVVFGETLTGRNAPVSGVEQMEGPMITTVPVRIRVNRSSMASEYLQEVHDQSVLRFPHEHLGLQHIRRLSPDAKEACELRTGLVLHPYTEEGDGSSVSSENEPANGFIPAADADAAREALKFNSYALMLVCSIDSQGLLIMASFDSKTVVVPQMEKMLEQFGYAIQKLCGETSGRLGNIELLKEQDRADLWKLSESGARSIATNSKILLGDSFSGVTATWIVDSSDAERLLPKNAIGELLVSSSTPLSLESINSPRFLVAGCTDTQGRHEQLYKTGRLVKYGSDGTIVFLGSKDDEITDSQNELKPRKESKKIILPPTTPRQQTLVNLWSRVLGIASDEISIDDSFFDLGGDSIGAMKLVSEARMAKLELTMAKVFRHKRLYEMATVIKDSEPSKAEPRAFTPFAVLDVPNAQAFVAEKIQPALARQDWKVANVLPARPLQAIAVRGTVQLPRFSARYEIFYMDAGIDRSRLFKSCQELVDRNEILRTVFVQSAGQCFSVVLEKLDLPVVEYEIEADLEAFSHQLCDLDVQTTMPLGSSFLKFIFVQCLDGRSCLILRISHAQYDEICLPLILRQLSAIYEERPLPETIPFSNYVGHVVRDSMPQSIEYFRNLLRGSSLTILKPTASLASNKAGYVDRTFDISARSKDITIATLPTAAWAICLARHLSIRDVTFGEVVSGRNIEFPNSDKVVGPCWQYIPFRVQFGPGWTGQDLLEFVQQQHIASSRYESIGLQEIIDNCTDWGKSVEWFDSVVHQDVEHVENLGFLAANSRMETIYPHPEPLREWKIQAYPQGDKIHIEIVTYEPFLDLAATLLNDLEKIMMQLVKDPQAVIFEQ